MPVALFKEQPGKRKRSIASLFDPLKQNKAVAFAVLDRRMPKRSRVIHGMPLLLLAPSTLYGAPAGKIIVSLETHGCEILDCSERFKPIQFYRLGLNMRLASALSTALNRSFHGGKNANRTTSHRTS